MIPKDLEWLESRTILLHRAGSHAYGTNTPESDLDVRGVAIAPLEYHLGVSKVFEQRVASEPIDLVIYEFKKFVKLCLDANPNIIESLWVDESDILVQTDAARELRAHRDLFLSKRIKHTFSGYAISQLKRIKTHRRYLLNPIEKEPIRVDYDLPERKLLGTDDMGAAEAEIRKVVDTWELDLSDLDDARRIYLQGQIEKTLVERCAPPAEEQAARLLGMDSNLMEYLDRERRFRTAKAEYASYQNWKKTRNQKRFELEEKFGYDCKHAAHLYRLLTMCREILTTGEVRVKRPDAEDILAIRNGAWSYDEILSFAETEDEALNEIMKRSTLPKQPDREGVDKLCARLLLQSFA